MKVRPAEADREQELRRLLDLCERSEPLPRGVKSTAQAEFYSMARRWVPSLVRAYRENLNNHKKGTD